MVGTLLSGIGPGPGFGAGSAGLFGAGTGLNTVFCVVAGGGAGVLFAVFCVVVAGGGAGVLFNGIGVVSGTGSGGCRFIGAGSGVPTGVVGAGRGPAALEFLASLVGATIMANMPDNRNNPVNNNILTFLDILTSLAGLSSRPITKHKKYNDPGMFDALH